MLLQATKLNSVTVSWVDTTDTGGWTEKAQILRPLRKLSGKAKFRVGEIKGSEDVNRESFARAMRDVLGQGQMVEGGLDGTTEDEPARLRMLAFDVRQDRHLYRSREGWYGGVGRKDSGIFLGGD